jgi:hypothetical protein
MWYVFSISPSVESTAIRLVVLVGSEVPALTRSSVLMVKLRISPHGAHAVDSRSVTSVVQGNGPLRGSLDRHLPSAVAEGDGLRTLRSGPAGRTGVGAGTTSGEQERSGPEQDGTAGGT